MTRVAPPDPHPSNLARPRPRAWIGESLRTAAAHPGPLVAAAMVIAIVCITVLLTTGRTVATEQAVLDRLDSMGTRVVSVSDNGGTAGMAAGSLEALSSLESVQWAIGLGGVADAHNAALPVDGTGVASRPIYGDLRKAVALVSGRWPAPGEAIVSEQAAHDLHLGAGIGGATTPDGIGVPIVGVYRSDPAIRGLNNLIAIVPPETDPQDPALYLYLMARSVGEVDRLASAIPTVLTVSNPAGVMVETPEGLRAARDTIASDLAASSRFLMLATLGVGLAIVMVTMFAAVSERKADFGRRRALGASRSAIVAMVLIQALCSAALGALIGVAAGLGFSVASGQALPPSSFVLGVATLTTVTTMLAAAPPALVASRRDPVRILRVP